MPDTVAWMPEFKRENHKNPPPRAYSKEPLTPPTFRQTSRSKAPAAGRPDRVRPPGLRDLEPSALEGRIVAVTTPPAVGMELFEGIRDAARAGAAGLLIILHPAVPREVVGVVAGQLTGVGLPLQAVPAAGVPYGVASEMLAAGGVDLDALTGAAADLASVPTEADGVTVSVEAPLDRAFSTPPNVVGLLRGHDPDLADTYVVLSAHFDHVGIGEPDASGDSIYNGADDDASGTADRCCSSR